MGDFKEFIFSAKDVHWLDFKKIFSWNYLADSALPLSGPLVALLGYFFLALIIVGIVLPIIIGKKNKKLPIYHRVVGHIRNLSLWLGAIGIVLVLSRFEGIYILSSRFLLLSLMLLLIVWAAWIIYYSIFQLPKLAIAYQKKQSKDKYLPKNKKKI